MPSETLGPVGKRDRDGVHIVQRHHALVESDALRVLDEEQVCFFGNRSALFGSGDVRIRGRP
jgi:hypothetical protein